MFLSKFFRRRRNVVQRIEEWTKADQVIVCHPQAMNLASKIAREEGGEIITRDDIPSSSIYTMPRSRYLAGDAVAPRIHVGLPMTVDGALLADQFERELQRRGLA